RHPSAPRWIPTDLLRVGTPRLRRKSAFRPSLTRRGSSSATRSAEASAANSSKLDSIRSRPERRTPSRAIVGPLNPCPLLAVSNSWLPRSLIASLTGSVGAGADDAGQVKHDESSREQHDH